MHIYFVVGDPLIVSDSIGTRCVHVNAKRLNSAGSVKKDHFFGT
ncbi:MAG: hypothetical protein P8Y18_05040 [Candidatus Bathyarchaeota archaeon]